MRRTVFLAKAAILAIAVYSCKSTTGPNFPPAPPTPQGFIACVGHVHSYSDAGLLDNSNKNIWYAFWNETPDSTRATLIVGINPNEIDSIFLLRDTSFFSEWKFLTWDSTYAWASLYVTSDSVTEGSFGVDAGTYYYLKKLQ